MARGLDRIWVRFGLSIAATVVVAMVLLTAGMALFWAAEYQNFYNALPSSVRSELDDLKDRDLEDSPRAMQIYSQYWRSDLLFGEQVSLVIGLVVGLPFGLAVGFWVSRIVTQPLASMAEVARRVAIGDFAARAHPGRARGEMADMLRDFNHMIDSLEGLERERRVTAASISHELRTPLAVQIARLHAICDGVIPASDSELRALLDQAEHLGRLVSDLHTLSMTDAGQLSLYSERLELDALVGDALAGYARRIAEHGAELEWRPPREPGTAIVEADPDRLRQILSNLLENALRHGAAGRWIGVAVEAEGGYVKLSVSDAGPGLPAWMRERPFERFPRGPGRQGGGSGLGLSIVRALALQLGGAVRAGTSERGGACFTVTLPAAPAGD
ncbi:ATP-binding protein [Pigmentiphaga soli]|uniref:histidine kinase n=1 Tax=Pigmentiphaga soli TaxID=1007095 RepID=A0ABP8H907_9BURK